MQMEALKREQDRLFETMSNSIEQMRENNKRLIADIQKVTSSVKSLNNA
jgi:ribosomal protein S17E